MLHYVTISRAIKVVRVPTHENPATITPRKTRFLTFWNLLTDLLGK